MAGIQQRVVDIYNYGRYPTGRETIDDSSFMRKAKPAVYKPQPFSATDSGFSTPTGMQSPTPSVGYGRSSSHTGGLLGIGAVDFQALVNAKVHRTNEFHCVIHQGRPVIRRGQLAQWVIHTTRDYDPQKDEIRIKMDFGEKPSESDGTRAICTVQDKNVGLRNDTFAAKMLKSTGNKLLVEVITPHDYCVGKWTCYILTNKKGNRHDAETFKASSKLCILFNPWCREDDVYLDDENLRNEYVLNDTGLIYNGDCHRMGAFTWIFGQFEENILDAAIAVVDRNLRQTDPQCYNAILVARNISSMVTAKSSNNGILVCRKNGPYSGGKNPLNWGGSVQILRHWLKKERATKYGQCFVYSGVTTTILRALGIPCRSITNFKSAKAKDGNVTIERYMYKHQQNGIWKVDFLPTTHSKYHGDSVWNYRCWNECWMKRPDLPQGPYGGWQVIDSTPQEDNDGSAKVGPTSLAAVRKGEIHHQYDTPFVFGEVNGDIFDIIISQDTGDELYLAKAEKPHLQMGRNISTKKPGSIQAGREDITHLYKNPNMSLTDRASILAAVGRSNAYTIKRYACQQPDVIFDLQQNGNAYIGQQFDINFVMTSHAQQNRTINVAIELHTMFYTASKWVINASPREYLHLLAEQAAFRVSALGYVEETQQVACITDSFLVRVPDIHMQADPPHQIGRPFRVHCKLRNPLPVHLRRCRFYIEAPGLERLREITCSDVAPGGEAQVSTQCTPPSRSGNKVLIARFASDQLTGANGTVTIKVSA